VTSSSTASSAAPSSSSDDNVANFIAPSSAARSSDPSPSPSPAPAPSSDAPAPAPSQQADNSGGGSPAPAPAANGGSVNAGSKLGLGWPNGNFASPSDPDYIGNYVGSKSSWYYTWSPDNVGAGDSVGLEFVPMLWGPNQVSDWWNAQASWPSSVKNVFFLNEPEISGQSDIAAADAVSLWMNDYLPVRSKGMQLGGAAVTSDPGGLEWVQDFYAACTNDGNSAADCSVDFYPIHYYDVTVDGFQSYVQNYNQVTGKNLWITEYDCQNFNGGAQCTSDQTWNFHQSMAEWFDNQDYVIKYSPFIFMEDLQGVNTDNAGMNPDGSITALGSWYINSA